MPPCHCSGSKPFTHSADLIVYRPPPLVIQRNPLEMASGRGRRRVREDEQQYSGVRLEDGERWFVGES